MLSPGATSGTDVRAYPKPASGGAVPTVSNLNLTKGATRANLAIVKPGDSGRVRIRNEAASSTSSATSPATSSSPCVRRWGRLDDLSFGR